MGDADIARFAEPLEWLQDFPPIGKRHLIELARTVDWRRSFITTQANVWLLSKPIHDDWLDGKPLDNQNKVDTRRFWQKKKPTSVRWLYWFSTSEWFEKAIIFIILLNTIILSIHYPQMPTGLEAGLRYLNICFKVLFAL